MGKIGKSIYYSIVIFRNTIINKIPSRRFRKACDIILGAKIGKSSVINRNCDLIKPICLKIGNYCAIGFYCLLDARGELEIGNNVVIASYVKVITGSHIVDSESFQAQFKKITIKDRAWIGSGAIILPGVTIGEGAVVAAGSVVVHDVDDFAVVGGNPAKFIKWRNKNINYTIAKTPPLH